MTRDKSAFAVDCPEHGKVYLTYSEYTAQMNSPNSLWKCPICDKISVWDDENYDDYIYAEY